MAKNSEIAERKWRKHLKPKRALGVLEDATFRLTNIRKDINSALRTQRLLLFIADHGIAFRKVSAMKPSATAHLIDRVSAGGTAANIFCDHTGIQLVAMDVGSRYKGVLPEPIMDRRIAAGTKDISRSCAMSIEQTQLAIEHGRRAVQDSISAGIEMIGVGEIGIGNTTIAAALTSCVLRKSPQETVGLGTGITQLQLKRKRKLVQTALDLHRNQYRDPFRALACLGGFEIAAIVGVILECAEMKMPLMLDGFATCTAALIATRLSARVPRVLFFSHYSREPGQRLIIDHLKQKAFFDLEFSLGEGTGAVLGMHFLSLGTRVLANVDCF